MRELNDIQRVVKFLATWVAEIRFFNAVDFYDINRVAENVAVRLLNLVFKLELKNLNEEKKNFPGVDLGDDSRKIAFQVTSENTPQKIKECLDKFVNGPHLRFTNGIRFFIVNNKKPILSKDKYARIWSGFDPGKHILNDEDLVKEIEKIYHDDHERFQEILKYLEDEFGHGGKSEGIKSLLASSKIFYEKLRGPNGRFRYLKISDILLPGTKSQWLETNVELEENNKKLLRGGEGGDFLEKSPPITKVLPILWRMEVKHAVIVGDGGMGKTVSLIHWWERLLESREPVKPVPVFIALNEFNQVKEIKREDFIVNYVVENYGKEGGVPVTADQVKKIMKTPLRSGSGFIPSIVFLLDGFNEITADKRELLLELNHLTEQFPGIQVVITSRYDMRGNFNWSHWHLVKLKELADEQVEEYLRDQGTAVPGMENGGLWNPMMLTLYAETVKPSELPENLDSSDKALLLRNIAEIYRKEGKFDKAYSFGKEAIEIDNLQESEIIYKLAIYAALAGDISNALIHIKSLIDCDRAYSGRVNNDIDWEDIKRNILNHLGCFASGGALKDPHSVDEIETLFNGMKEVKEAHNHNLLKDLKERFRSAYERMKNPAYYISFNCIRNLFKLKDIHPRVEKLISLCKSYGAKKKEYSELEHKFKTRKLPQNILLFLLELLIFALWVKTAILFAREAHSDLTGNIIEQLLKIVIWLFLSIIGFMIQLITGLFDAVLPGPFTGQENILTSERFIWAYITIFTMCITVCTALFFIKPEDKLKDLDEERTKIENEIKTEETNIKKQFDDIEWE